jgi:preprotein translocase subunit SecE
MSVRQWPAKTERFLKEVKLEMLKVSWPTRQSVTGSTMVVLVAVVVLSVYMWMTDFVFAKLLKVILNI